MTVELDYIRVIRINAPEFYQRADFMAWLNDPQRIQATWHGKGCEPSEYSDLFFTYADGDGSDSDMPEEVWKEICRAMNEAGVDNALIWLSNLAE